MTENGFMKFKTAHFFCSPRLLQNIPEINEIYTCLERVKWQPDFFVTASGHKYKNQRGYNKAFEEEFLKYQWETQPLLYHNPRLIGDFRKNDIFVEIQFGNSATLYRDYYKFHYGLTYGLLSIAVLIVPVNPKEFFPTRPRSVSNMADFNLAYRYFKLLPIPVPILLIGLLAEN
ncbi:MAG: BglII/BstYI family type II restriction endonuclease [Dehalococcoidia bacterium]